MKQRTILNLCTQLSETITPTITTGTFNATTTTTAKWYRLPPAAKINATILGRRISKETESIKRSTVLG